MATEEGMAAGFEWADFASSASLLALGAILTGFLVPFVTRRWQNHQKELELKADLLRRVSDAVTRIITHGWFTRLADKNWGNEDDRREFDWRYGEWLTETRVLEAELQAYYQDHDALSKHWRKYCEMLQAFHEITWTEPLPEDEKRPSDFSEADHGAAQKERRETWLAKLKERYKGSPNGWTITTEVGARNSVQVYKPIELPTVKWCKYEVPPDSLEFDDLWPCLKLAMEAPLAPLGEAILKTPMQPLRGKWP